jgi:hypothetical protein
MNYKVADKITRDFLADIEAQIALDGLIVLLVEKPEAKRLYLALKKVINEVPPGTCI